MERLKLFDSITNAIIKMAEGNPGAMEACMSLIKNGDRIAPPNIGGMIYIFDLDREGIYGTDIYVFWNDICNRETLKMIAVLEAVRLRLFSGRILAEACHRQDYSGRDMVPVEDLYKRVFG